MEKNVVMDDPSRWTAYALMLKTAAQNRLLLPLIQIGVCAFSHCPPERPLARPGSLGRHTGRGKSGVSHCGMDVRNVSLGHWSDSCTAPL